MIASQPAVFVTKEAEETEKWMAEQAKLEEEKIAEKKLAAKLSEEKMAAGCNAELFVPKRPKVAHQIGAVEAASEEEVKSMAKAEKKEKKMKLVRMDEASIIAMLKNMPRGPFPGIRNEVFDWMDPERRAFLADIAAGAQKFQDYCEDIREQYLAKGYAEIEEEVVDSDEEDEDYKGYLEYMAARKARQCV